MKNKTIEKAISICGSQLRLAQECGVSQVSVSFWLNGGGIGAKYIPLIAKATNGKISEIEILKSLTCKK
ncbi:helix-turn-helix domain-containing protein [Pasteurella multocida]|uniref:YdaS family helix-turn-helix protein n=1 Tax=Pasteurella multocida TaxID=747 RepID=UPI000C194DA2|nr:YdaS family helix-turn-helix protein [Pasteurella multocida]MBF6983770.1 helix-turn-helix domain-containing protein [Pasteurella multocida]MBR8514965.1 helix-turn-helix domain-containing protein [Pasteurella multocida]MDY0489409.1 helix-turn-helix domain-containing protein [Pasteurella multocida]MDY0595909.1 helix-turn-helix domain-containing protein [Pasteurella multocida]MDY0665310.1 helix-turn-helix domain-containing protein [Pasteurella multocida]